MRLRHDNGLGIKITAKSIAFMMGLSFNQVWAILLKYKLNGYKLIEDRWRYNKRKNVFTPKQ